jgi:hypothetical protein
MSAKPLAAQVHIKTRRPTETALRLELASGTASMVLPRRRMKNSSAAVTAPQQSFALRSFELLKKFWQWLQRCHTVQKMSRKLQLMETVQLGDKRFAAILEADGQRFLVGGSGNSVTLLAELGQTRVKKSSRRAVAAASPKAAKPFKVPGL